MTSLIMTPSLFSHLHSIMYLLIRFYFDPEVFAEYNLHSIMYLLIRDKRFTDSFFRKHLHSIMYLLIPVIFDSYQYNEQNLHSIMYLLILTSHIRDFLNPISFTFHNVSINSRPPATIISSIVFLLFLSTSFYSPHLTSIFLL